MTFKKKISSYSLIIVSIILIISCQSTHKMNVDSILSQTPFGVCYAKVSADQIENYKMVILEPDYYSKGEVQALKATGTKLIAYITLGEIDSNRWYFPILEARGFLGKNTNWNSHFLDLSDEETRKIILDRILPEIMIKGFDGIFMDTIDAVAPYTERKDLAPYMSDMIKQIRNKYPNKVIIQNAGLFLLNETSLFIDAVLIEDIASGYDFNNNEYFIKDKTAFTERLALVDEASSTYDLPFFILDFAVQESSINEIKSRLDTLKYPYFISNIQLTELPKSANKMANKIRGN